MPLSSADIAGQTGQWQQLYAGQMQYSGMIGGMMNMSGPPQLQGEQVAGGIMNRVGGIAGPAASFGLGMMGMDPLSLGLRAGMGAYGAGAGVVGAGAAGIGIAGAAALPLMAAQYAGSQMMTGAQQQQQFNSNMRGTYGFNQPFGQGFSTNQLGVMGADIRGMTGQGGAMGEMTSFRELAGLAANMGRMGMATGVRDVQAFKQRFSEMLTTVKTVATELGTTLQQAQEAMASMRGSGIFRTADQVKFAMQMRQYSVAGGLSTAELGAMGSIGAQISRSVGGRGGAGAFAGMRTLGTIGTAVQTGILSDEDIYNATGMYGAEGRQALATRQMESSANFLKSGRGRYFLASVAGQGGHLDEESVNAWMGGGMSVGETRGQAHRNLGRIGRAGFLRNEGRLRGAAMEKFGGLLPAMALSQWAGEKGIDINSMGDREMLFASRQLGMGMDELEATLKEAKNLPRIMASQQQEGLIDQSLKQLAMRRRTQGLEGMKRKFEQFRQGIQNQLQQVGADFYTTGADMIDRFINNLAGTTFQDFDRDAMETFRAGGAKNWARTNAAAIGTGGMGKATAAGLDVERARKAGFGGAAGFYGQGGKGRYQGGAAGFISDFYGNMADPRLTGAAGPVSAQLRETLQAVYTNQGAGGGAALASLHGEERVQGLMGALSMEAAKGNTEAREKLQLLQRARPEQRGALALGIEQSINLTPEARVSAGREATRNLLGGGIWSTVGARNEAGGAGFLGQERSEQRVHRDLMAAGALVASGPIGWGALLVGAATEGVSAVKQHGQQQKVGDWFYSKEGKEYVGAMASNDPATFRQAFGNAREEYQKLLAKDPSTVDSTDLDLAKRKYAVGLARKTATDAGRQMTQEDLDNAAKSVGMEKGSLNSAVSAIRDMARDQALTRISSVSRMLGDPARATKERLLQTGLVTKDKYGALEVSGKLKGDKLFESFIRQTSEAARLDQGLSPEQELALQSRIGKQQEERTAGEWSMSAAERSKEIKKLEESGAYPAAAELRGVGAEDRRIKMMERRGGAAGAAMSILGVGLNRETAYLWRNLQHGMSGKGQLKSKLTEARVEASVEDIIKAGGGDPSKNLELTKELTAALTEPNKQKQAHMLSTLQTGDTAGAKELREMDKKKREDADRDKNPILGKIEGHLDAISKSSTIIEKSTALTSQAAVSIAINTSKDGGVVPAGQHPGEH